MPWPAGRPVQRGDVVGHVDGDTAQYPHGLLGGLARLQHVADHQRDAEALADLRPAAEGERDGQASVVDPVEQPPQAVEHAKHPPAGVRRPGHHRVEEPEIPVVVADQGGTAGQHRRLRAAGQERRRVPQCQRGGGLGDVAEQGGQPLPCRNEFRQVLLKPHPGLLCRRPGVRAVEPPPPERRPGRRQVLTDLFTRFVLFERPQGKRNLAPGSLRRGGLFPWRGRPRPRGPVRRGDPPEPGAPV